MDTYEKWQFEFLKIQHKKILFHNYELREYLTDDNEYNFFLVGLFISSTLDQLVHPLFLDKYCDKLQKRFPEVAQIENPVWKFKKDFFFHEGPLYFGHNTYRFIWFSLISPEYQNSETTKILFQDAMNSFKRWFDNEDIPWEWIQHAIACELSSTTLRDDEIDTEYLAELFEVSNIMDLYKD